MNESFGQEKDEIEKRLITREQRQDRMILVRNQGGERTGGYQRDKDIAQQTGKMLRTCYGVGVYYKSFFKQSNKDIFFFDLKIIEFWVFYEKGSMEYVCTMA